MEYNFKTIESRWKKKWESDKIFEVNESKAPKGVPLKGAKKKFYVLDMFPYPSGEGLHIGHAFVFSLGDIFARLKRLQGYNVLYPIGYDSLGLPAENAAIRAGTHPKAYTKKSIANFMKQQKAMGWSYDWSRMVKTSDPEFYKWDQWIFLKLFEKGLAYKKQGAVNWCPKCKTVLANEQVHNGKCEYHGDTNVEIKHLNQWFFKITNYAEELLNGLDKIDWPQRAKKLQRNWIGKSEGTQIDFKVNGKDWKIFTTRPDTIYGVTFMVVSAQHPELMNLVTTKQKKEVESFLKKLKSVSEKELGAMDKEGVFTGSYATNPMNNEKVPVYAGNFVVADYGSGMVMAVPAHDQRDFDFAKKYKIKIKQVIKGGNIKEEAYTGDGNLINSEAFNDLNSREAKGHITRFLETKKLGKKTTQYKLKDWLISRQRYWGTPIPIVYCEKCGVVPVKEKDLPVKLPDKVKFGKGNPLETNEKFVNVKCPKCKGKARRETDTMDTFVNSSWYFLRYCDPNNAKNIFDKKKVDYWCPVDQYIGGPEHITMHLIYARFYTKFLRDIGLLKFDEPALKYFTQGIVKASDGEKMSKTKGNVVEPLDMIKKYGADSLRLYLVSNSSPNNDFDWDDKGMKSSFKFVKKIYDYFSKIKFKPHRGISQGKKNSVRIESKLNKVIKQVTEDAENFRHNLAVIKLRDLFNNFDDNVDRKAAESFLKMFHIYCPYFTEELWNKLGNKKSIAFEKWPKADEKKIDENLEKEEEAVEKLLSDINHVKKITGKLKAKVYVYVLPQELKIYEDIEQINLFSVNDKEKYDPEGKSKKVKPGKPGIYLE
jgi:leucyl-tRNA synthetase